MLRRGRCLLLVLLLLVVVMLLMVLGEAVLVEFGGVRVAELQIGLQIGAQVAHKVNNLVS